MLVLHCNILHCLDHRNIDASLRENAGNSSLNISIRNLPDKPTRPPPRPVYRTPSAALSATEDSATPLSKPPEYAELVSFWLHFFESELFF